MGAYECGGVGYVFEHILLTKEKKERKRIATLNFMTPNSIQ
jgi:hypothetical protein